MHKKTNVSFAAKFLKRRRRAQCTLKEIRHEIAILSLCSDSEHIVKLHSVFETTVETALVLELATGGELQTLLDENGSLNESQTRFCMREVLKALQYLHRKSIAHLDLKPQNILLCGTCIEDGLKLCDFGISRVVAEGGSKVREILGTPDYVAPEVSVSTCANEIAFFCQSRFLRKIDVKPFVFLYALCNYVYLLLNCFSSFRFSFYRSCRMNHCHLKQTSGRSVY